MMNQMKNMLPWYILPCVVLGAALLLAGCTGPPDTGAQLPGASAAGAASVPAAAVAASAPPVGVTTVRARQMDLPVVVSATGAVTPVSSVDVRPQVTSVVTRVHIREGQFVRAGELMFTLDARTDEANLARARAQLAKDEAGLADAQRQLTRSRELLAQNFVSQGALDANQAAVESQSALVAADRAALDAARVALSNARVTATGAGRAGAVSVYPGSSVQANQTTLVTITQLDPINVTFNLPQRHLAEALAALQGGGAAVNATLPETGASLGGRLQFVDSAVDAASGTVKVKALFENRAGQLWPGAFVNVAMTVRTLKAAVVVPQVTIIQGQRGSLVYAVQDGKAVPRPVQVVYAQAEDAAVSGLKPGERIVLDGRQNLRPGVSVVERPREGGGRGAAASGAAAGAAPGGSAPRKAAGATAGVGNGAAAKEGPTP
jgi:RND family efflux transporter MFP subunit